MSSNYGFEPTLDGLNNIDADSTTTTDIICDNLTVNVSGTAPTMASSDNSTHLATTAFVNSHASANYVTLGTTQTITGEKTFSNTNTLVSGTLKNDSHQGSTITSTQNIATTQTSGVLSIASLAGRSGAVNINTGATSTAAVNISSATTGNAPITIGSASSTTQTATHNAISTFTAANTYTTGTLNCSNLSGLALNVIDDSNLSNVTIDGVSFFNDIATFNLGATFNSVLPTSTVVPVSGPDLTNKTYVDSVVPASILPLNNTFTGTNTFNNTLDVVISAVNKLSISSSSITLNPTTTITNQIGGVSKMTINSTTTTIDNSSFLLNQIGGVNKVYISNTNVTTNPTTTTDFQVNGTTMLQLTTSDLNVNASAGFTFIPTGTINTSVVSTVPNGFLYCNGAAVSRATYARLYAAIGTTFGVGNGTTTFNVPNFLGAFLRGESTQTVGGIAYAGAAVGTAQQDSVLALSTITNQGYWNIDAGGGGASRQVKSRVRIGTDPIDSGTFGAGIDASFPRENTTEVRPFNYSVYYYIKY